jgi:hypothetical protein
MYHVCTFPQVIRFSYDPSRKPTVFNAFSKMFFQASTPKEDDETKKTIEESNASEGTSLEELGDAPLPTLDRIDSSASTSSCNGESGILVDENSVKRLMDMGFLADVSKRTLIKHNGNETAAINELLGSS